MRVASPFLTAPRRKTKLYRRVHIHEVRRRQREAREEARKRAKLLAKKHEYEYQATLRRYLQSEEAA